MPAIQISYSNTIFYLKIALFCVGLFAIILIFLSAKKIELGTEVPFAKDINVTSLNDGLTKPLHSSITNSGDVLQITAEQIILTDEKDTALVKSVSFTISTGEGSQILLSSKIISPEHANIFSFNNPSDESAVKDFPEPDSPTIPNASPRLSSKDRLLIRLVFVFFSFIFKSLNSRILMMIFH